MKTIRFTILLLTAFAVLGADTPAPSNAPSAIITGVTTAKAKNMLVIRYEQSGRSHEQPVAFPSVVTDFCHCRWLGDRGIAVAVSTRVDDGYEFYYCTVYLTGFSTAVTPLKIPAPPSKSQLLGIANTGGDSIVITAARHQRQGNADGLTGWPFIDNCPPSGAAIGRVIPFDVSTALDGKVK